MLFQAISERGLDQIFLRLIKQSESYCGVSTVFNSLERRAAYIQQAELANDTARLQNLYGQCTVFSQSLSEIILLQPLERLNRANLIPQEIQRLIDYDDQHETELVKTLSSYLYQRNDINKTSKLLHVHRNTLIYRLNKIRDLTAVEIDEPEVAWTLQLVFRVLEVLERNRGSE